VQASPTDSTNIKQILKPQINEKIKFGNSYNYIIDSYVQAEKTTLKVQAEFLIDKIFFKKV